MAPIHASSKVSVRGGAHVYTVVFGVDRESAGDDLKYARTLIGIHLHAVVPRGYSDFAAIDDDRVIGFQPYPVCIDPDICSCKAQTVVAYDAVSAGYYCESTDTVHSHIVL